MPLRPKPIAELSGTRNDGNLTIVIELTDAVQTIAYNADLRLKLCLIGHLLEIASTAIADIWAWRLDPRPGRLDDRIDISKGDLTLYLTEPDPKAVTEDGQVDEDRQTVCKGHPV